MAKDFAKPFYNSRLWINCRKQILRRDLYTCRDCHGRAEEVHHVVELTPQNINDHMIALNPNNLVSLCRKCHSKITMGDTGDTQDDYAFDDEGQVIRR